MGTEQTAILAAFERGTQRGPRSPTAAFSRQEAEEFRLRPRLLIVEDDASLREVWEVIFRCRGWDVTSASTVAEGLALLDPPPDYLILDLGLPDAGGEIILR